MNIGIRIKERRQQLKMSAELLGKKIGVNKTTIYRYESGEIQKIPIDVVQKLSDTLGIPVYDFLEPGFLEIGIEMLDRLIEKHGPESHEGKALRFFEEQDRNEILYSAISRLKTAPGFSSISTPEKARLTNGLALSIEYEFVNAYEKRVKSNENLVYMVEKSIISSDEIMEYPDYGKDITVNLDALGFTLLATEYEVSVDQELLEELSLIVEETKTRIKDLLKKYPDKKSNIGTDIYALYSKDETKAEHIANLVDGKDILNSSNVDKDTKDLLVSLIKQVKQKK
ncbi:helix-turn-helix transcriptional regulator [Listeria booriae]|uniref:Helix-turn-helix transcriptional regulator n=1 Tax=Listeria booriae TaxID=1552123 RepID=A0A7X1DPL1_9LIST|nr:helix-turn-helix transcriptional regulator [Listeria booriae]MBC2370570.1 helix-turn-helix transcriptional regulator [Listeria booriae]